MTLDARLYHLNIKLSVVNMHWGIISHLTFRKSGRAKRFGQDHIKQFIILFRNIFLIINMHLKHCKSMNSTIMHDF